MTRTVGGIAGALDRRFTEIPRMPPERPLSDVTVGQTIEGHAEMLQLDDGFRRVVGQHLDGILISQVIRAFHRVEHVPLGVVLFEVAQWRRRYPLEPHRSGSEARKAWKGQPHPGFRRLPKPPSARPSRNPITTTSLRWIILQSLFKSSNGGALETSLRSPFRVRFSLRRRKASPPRRFPALPARPTRS